MEKTFVIVATHKPYRMPEDPVYLPVQVGAAGYPDTDFTRDDTGENISSRNVNWCELTGLYWAWKNLNCAALGLVHYRRHFAGRRLGDKWRRIATGAEIAAALRRTGIVLPVKRRYFIETNYSQYIHAHHRVDLELTRTIIAERHPDSLAAFDAVMRRTSGHRFNMFVMRRELADDYCAWLFDILFELERRLDISNYNAYDARVFGFVAERLLDVWLTARGHAFTELAVVQLEPVNWLRKGSRFLARKFCKAT